MPDPVRVAFRMDDLAATPGHTRAALDAFAAGLARSGGVMVVTDEFPRSAPAIADFLRGRRDLDVGLHLCVNCEWQGMTWKPAATDVPALTDDAGHLLPRPKDLHARGGFPVEQMLREFDAQLARLRDAGIEPTYADEHMGFSWAAGEGEAGPAAARDWCDRNGLLYAPPLPNHRPPRRGDGTFDVDAVLASLPPGEARVIVLHPAEPGEIERSLTTDAMPPGEAARQRDGDRRLLADPRLIEAVREGRLLPLTLREVAAVD